MTVLNCKLKTCLRCNFNLISNAILEIGSVRITIQPQFIQGAEVAAIKEDISISPTAHSG